jgi:hypothetical protein
MKFILKKKKKVREKERKRKRKTSSQAPMAHTCNPSYSGSRDQEDQENSHRNQFFCACVALGFELRVSGLLRLPLEPLHQPFCDFFLFFPKIWS